MRTLSRTEELCKEVRARRRGCSLGGSMQVLTTAPCSPLRCARRLAAARLLGNAVLV